MPAHLPSYYLLIRNFPVTTKTGNQVDHGHQVAALADGAIKITTKRKCEFTDSARVVIGIHDQINCIPEYWLALFHLKPVYEKVTFL